MNDSVVTGADSRTGSMVEVDSESSSSGSEETEDEQTKRSRQKEEKAKAGHKEIARLRNQVALKESKNVKLNDAKELKSLSMFLQTSMNTEMVYSILTGLCKFALLNHMGNKITPEQLKEFQEMEYRVDQNGATTITMREIKIRNIESWERIKADDLLESKVEVEYKPPSQRKSTLGFWKDRNIIQLDGMDRTLTFDEEDIKRQSMVTGAEDKSYRSESIRDLLKAPEGEEDSHTTIDAHIELTYHKLYEFGKLFQKNKLGIGLLE